MLSLQLNHKFIKRFNRISLNIISLGLVVSCTPSIEQPKPAIEDLTEEMVYYWDESDSMEFEDIEALFHQDSFYCLKSLNQYTNPKVLWAVYERPIDSSILSCEDWGFCLVTSPSKQRHSFNIIEAFYKSTNGNTTQKKTGTLTHTRKKEEGWEFSRNCFHLDEFQISENNTIILFFKLFSAQSYQPRLYGYNTTQLEEFNRWAAIVASQPLTTYFRISFFAIFLYFLIYGLIQYIQIRERAFLFYSIYIFFLLAFDAENIDYTYNGIYSFFGNFTEWHYYMEVPLAASIYISYMLFIASFLNLKEENSKAMLFLYIGISYSVLLIFLDVVLRQIGGTYLSMFFYRYDRFPLFLLAVPFFYYIYKVDKERQHDPKFYDQHRLTKVILLGSGILILFSLFYMIIKNPLDNLREAGKWNPNNPFHHTRTYMILGFLSENLVFVLGLGYRTRLNETRLVRQIQRLLARLELVKVDSHTMKNILASISSLGYTNQEEAAVYLKKATELCEKWYVESLIENDLKHSLYQEIEDMSTWISLNNLLISNPSDKVVSKIQGHDTLNKTAPIVAKRLLLPFIENALTHGFQFKVKQQDNAERKRIKKLSINVYLEEGEDNYIIVIHDNGIGIADSQSFLSKKNTSISTGIWLTMERMEAEGITVRFEKGNPGTKVIIKIPA